MSLIIVIVKIVRIVIRNVVTEIHVVICCWWGGEESNLPFGDFVNPMATYPFAPKSPDILPDGGDNHSNPNLIP